MMFMNAPRAEGGASFDCHAALSRSCPEGLDVAQTRELHMRKFFVALICFIMSTGTAVAQCTVPNTLTNGTNADATQVMANFNALLNCLNNLPTATPVAPQGRLTLQ